MKLVFCTTLLFILTATSLQAQWSLSPWVRADASRVEAGVPDNFSLLGSVGLSSGYQFNEKIGVQAGVGLFLMGGRVPVAAPGSSSGPNSPNQQTFVRAKTVDKFVGFPIAVRYTIAQRSWRIYTSAGVTPMLLLSNRVSSLAENVPFISQTDQVDGYGVITADLAVGFEYQVCDPVSLYIQPHARHSIGDYWAHYKYLAIGIELGTRISL